MTTLNLSYTLGLNIKSQIGTLPSNYSNTAVDILEQVQAAILINSQEFTYPFALAGNDTITIDLVNLKFSLLKLILIKPIFSNKSGNPKIRYSYTIGTNVTNVEGSFIFITNELPTILPSTVPTTHSITLTNLSAYPIEGSLYLVGLKLP